MGSSTYHIFVHDLVAEAQIGVFAHEHGRTQRVRVSVDLTLDASAFPEKGGDFLSYDGVVAAVGEITSGGHIELVETFAARLAERCLADARVAGARVKIEKLDVLPGEATVGVVLERTR